MANIVNHDQAALVQSGECFLYLLRLHCEKLG